MALLVERLFDAPTRLKSNVTGRGKERLDPQIMQYIKAKAFAFYECNPSEIKGEWKKCIKSIDDKSRGLKRKIAANSVAAIKAVLISNFFAINSSLIFNHLFEFLNQLKLLLA